MATSSRMEEQLFFISMFSRWRRTVLKLMPSLRLISRLPNPTRVRLRISFSRPVSFNGEFGFSGKKRLISAGPLLTPKRSRMLAR